MCGGAVGDERRQDRTDSFRHHGRREGPEAPAATKNDRALGAIAGSQSPHRVRDPAVRLLVYSDLHLELARFTVPKGLEFDVAVLAGDIATPGGDAVRWAALSRVFGGRPVLLVPGNHEYYGTRRPAERQRMLDLARGSRVQVLDGDVVVLGGVRFLGTTLWTDFELDAPPVGSLPRREAMRHARTVVPDFGGAIGEGLRDGRLHHFTPGRSRSLHHRARRWLESTLAQPHAGSTVVITHHAPSRRSLDPAFAGSPLNPCFASDLPPACFAGVDLWIHGHLHCSHDHRLPGGPRVVCNPRGVVNGRGEPENPRFDAAFVVDL
jgi:hypothetical protein